MEDDNKDAAKMYTKIFKEHGDVFLDWLQNEWLTNTSLFEFTRNEEVAIKTMNKFLEENNISE